VRVGRSGRHPQLTASPGYRGASVSYCARNTGMSKGTVKWFNDSKGYGFISQTEGEDVFVHFSSMVGDGFRTLAEGEEVEFELATNDKGCQAANVIRA
jgi:CspA family cold shock protein